MKADGRTLILDSLKEGLAEASGPEAIVPEGVPKSTESLSLERLGRQVEAVGGIFLLVSSPEEARQALGELIRREGITTAVTWEAGELPCAVREWLVQGGVRIVQDFGPDQGKGNPAARADLGVTGCSAAVMESGTIVVTSGPGRERSTSLLPAAHLAIVTGDTPLLESIADLGMWLRELARQSLPSAVHCISGPSATADIELIKVLGVHGPLKLYVLAVLPEE